MRSHEGRCRHLFVLRRHRTLGWRKAGHGKKSGLQVRIADSAKAVENEGQRLAVDALGAMRGRLCVER